MMLRILSMFSWHIPKAFCVPISLHFRSRDCTVSPQGRWVSWKDINRYFLKPYFFIGKPVLCISLFNYIGFSNIALSNPVCYGPEAGTVHKEWVQWQAFWFFCRVSVSPGCPPALSSFHTAVCTASVLSRLICNSPARCSFNLHVMTAFAQSPIFYNCFLSYKLFVNKNISFLCSTRKTAITSSLLWLWIYFTIEHHFAEIMYKYSLFSSKVCP